MLIAKIGKYQYSILGIYSCIILGFDYEFARFRYVKHKAPINAFPYVMCPSQAPDVIREQALAKEQAQI